MEKYDLTGRRFHKLVVESLSESRRRGNRVWKCKCDCGNYHEVTTHNLLKGTVKSCGCLPTKSPEDLTGKRYGRLLVLEVTDQRKSNGGAVCRCKCDCGKTVLVPSGNLNRGTTRSCGCVRIENLSGQRFGKLTVIKLGEKSNQGNGSFWLCKCDCGNISEVHASKLKSGHTYSCGCSHKDLINNLTGQRFGKLTVLGDSGKRRSGRGTVIWKCRCDCGQEKEVRQDALLGEKITSCGCQKSRGNAKITSLLKNAGIVFQAEYSPPDMDGRRRFDFAVFSGGKVAYFIEYDGILHWQYSDRGWDTAERFEQTIISDQLKNRYCAEKRIPLIRIPYTRLKDMTIDDLCLESTDYLFGKIDSC